MQQRHSRLRRPQLTMIELKIDLQGAICGKIPADRTRQDIKC